MHGSSNHLLDSVQPHPDSEGFLRRTRGLLDTPTKWSGILYRAAEPKYARHDSRLDGIGAGMHGGRWNPKGMNVVYGALSPETAMAEALALYRHYSMPVHYAMPRTFFAFEAKRLTRLLDLTSGMNRIRLRVSAERLQQCNWRNDNSGNREALTQTIARSALRAGFQGLIVDSAQLPGEANFVLFPAAKGVPEHLKTLNPEKLRG